ncbi:MAG: hypothetical protein ACRYF3_14595, partial [Janthinobacterium lividum]
VMSEVKDGTAAAMREGLQGRDRVLSAVEGVTASVHSLSTETRAAISELTESAQAMTRHSADFGEKVTGHVAALSTSAETSVQTMHATVVESVQKVTQLTGAAFGEHVAASTEKAATTMETLRRDVERTSQAAERALGIASATLAAAADTRSRHEAHDEKLQALLATQNAVLDTWRGVEARLESAAQDMRSVPRWLETIQHEHADATGRALASMGATLRDEVTENVRSTMAMAQDDHVRQVNRAYRDASRHLQQELTHSLDAVLENLPQRVSQHNEQTREPQQTRSDPGARYRPVPPTAPSRPERPVRVPERVTQRSGVAHPGERVVDRRGDERPPVSRERLRDLAPAAQRPETRPEPTFEPEPEPESQEAFVAAPPRTLSSLVARHYARSAQ